jgi:hypothetical protein
MCQSLPLRYKAWAIALCARPTSSPPSSAPVRESGEMCQSSSSSKCHEVTAWRGSGIPRV